MSSSKGFLTLYDIQLIDDSSNPTTTPNTTPENPSTTNTEATPSTNSTETTTSSGLIGPTEVQPQPYNPNLGYSQYPQYAQYAPFIPQSAQEEEGIPWGTIVTDFFGVIIFGGLVFLCFLGYIVYQKRYQDLVEEYASNPETQIKAQELTAVEKQHLDQWDFNPQGDDRVPGIDVTEEQTRLGQHFKIVFTPTGSQSLIRTIISNKKIERNKDNCYFEIEIEEIEVGVDIVIGLGTKDGFNKAVLPGDQRGSIGFHSKGGILKINGTEVNAYALEASFGETIGLGYNFDSSKIYLFWNAKYLNEPPREFGSPTKGSPEKSQTSPVKEGERPNKIDLDIEKREYYPLIGATGACKILLNIGGSPFSIHHKEIAKGLL